ncbi:hypothetical protein JCM9279_004999 [Rhodotorula babjevae]
MVGYIPLELVQLIASAALALGDNPREEERRARFALAKSLSLVCRSWRAVGQGALFRKVFVYAGQPNHGFLRSRHHLLSHVYELEVDAHVGSAMLDNKLARCRRDCDKLRSVSLTTPGAWSAWFSPARKVSPAESVTKVFMTVYYEDDASDAIRAALSGSRQFPNAHDVSLILSSSSPTATFPDLQGSTPWVAVRSLQIVVHLPAGPHSSLVRALSHVFPLCNLTTLVISTARASLAFCPVLREATAVQLLSIFVAVPELSSFIRQMVPALAVMSRLRALSVAAHNIDGRGGGHHFLPLSFLAKLPPSVGIVNLDLAVADASRPAFEAFLAQRLEGPLFSWTATRLDSAGAGEADTWEKVRRNGTMAWVRE